MSDTTNASAMESFLNSTGGGEGTGENLDLDNIQDQVFGEEGDETDDIDDSTPNPTPTPDETDDSGEGEGDDEGDQNDEGDDSDSDDDDTDDNQGNQEDDDLKGILIDNYNFLKEEGLLLVEDEEEFDGDPEKFQAAIDQTKRKFYEDAGQTALEDAIKYLQENPKDVDFLSMDLDSVEATTDDERAEVIRQAYKLTTKYSDEKIAKLINKARDFEILEDEYNDSLESLKEAQTSLRDRVLQETAQNRAEQEKQEREVRVKVYNTIDQADYIASPRKSKVKNLLTNIIQRGEDQPATTDFMHKLSKALDHPEHLVQLADLLLDYDAETGFNYDRLARVSSTKKLNTIQEKLKKKYSRNRSASTNTGDKKKTNNNLSAIESMLYS